MSAPRLRGHRRAGRLRAHDEARHFGLETATIVAIVGAAAAVASAGGVAASQIVQSRQVAATQDYNADIGEQQAELARRAGAAAEADTRAQATRIKAAQRAQLAEGGITGEGSPLLVLLDTAEQAEMEALRARYTGQVAEQGALSNVQLAKFQRNQAIQGGQWGAGTSLLTGAANVAGIYAKSAARTTSTGLPANPEYRTSYR